jgi:hypothetical protein
VAVNDSCSMPGENCSEPGCPIVKGLCRSHYGRLRRYGDPGKGRGAVKKRAPNGAPYAFLLYAVSYEGDDCLEWPYAVDGGGYGKIGIDGRTVQVHREVLRRAKGAPPEPGMDAAHEPVVCHNTLCVNPNHLRWATVSENHQDKQLDGTALLGERNPSARLTDEQAQAIIEDPRSQVVIAAEYGISQTAVSKIKRGLLYPHLDRSKAARNPPGGYMRWKNVREAAAREAA